MAANPIVYLHPEREGGVSKRRSGLRAIELLKEASAANVPRASKLLKLISRNIWYVKDTTKAIIMIGVYHEMTAYRPEWKLMLKSGRIFRVNVAAEDFELETADEPVNVTGAF